MPEFLPFAATRYNTDKVQMARVTAPPYDVIAPEFQEELYERDPHNVIRLILNHESDPYESAAHHLQEWKEDGILTQESEKAFYVYYQTFRDDKNEVVTRNGVIGLLKLQDYTTREVLPHERTLQGPKIDRLNLLRATKTNLSPIFGLTEDATFLFDHTLEIATVNPPLADIDEELPTLEHIRHTLWKLDDQTAIDRIEAIVARSPMIIADGHHRYETALAYAKESGLPESQYVMCYICNLSSPGTTILPTHRLVYDLKHYDQYRFLDALKEDYDLVMMETREEAMALLEREESAILIAQFHADPRYVVILVKQREAIIPVEELETNILIKRLGMSKETIGKKEHLLFPHTLNEIDELTAARSIDVAFILKPLQASQLASVVKEGKFLPQKSTYFYPKLLSGLVFHEFQK